MSETRTTGTDDARPEPRVPKGFRDLFAADVAERRRMIDTITGVYELFGFEALETPGFEYVDVLGKHLPESDTAAGGIFSLRDDDDQLIATRYDLTAPLARVVAQYGHALSSPFRRYQVGPVYRQEKPGPGRFREFTQCDFDTVGTAALAADAEVCAVVAACLDALGVGRGDYRILVNNRKVLNGVLETAGLLGDPTRDDGRRLAVLRAVDKLERLGEEGVELLLGAGRRDESGDFTPGAGLDGAQVDLVMSFVRAGGADRAAVCANLRELVGSSAVGLEGVAELEGIDDLLEAMDLGPDQVVFDPSIVRGLAYYTGPVYEATLTFEVEDEDGKPQPFGSILGGGRYDDLVKRFTGTALPATGASFGVDRLLAALRALRAREAQPVDGPVVVTTMDASHLLDYQRMVAELRAAGIRAELYLGERGFRAQLKYANKRRARVVVIAGSREFDEGILTLKDMRLGDTLSKEIEDREVWQKDQPAQSECARASLVEAVQAILAR